MKSDLLKEFQETEKKLLKKLKEASINLSEDASKDEFLSAIRKYIFKLQDLKLLFEKYERLAKKLASETDDDAQSKLEKNSIDEKKINQCFEKNKSKTNKNIENKGIHKKKLVDFTTNFSK